jgi:hypothetical protein
VKFAGAHAIVVWQELQSAVVTIWFVFLPRAVVPLWHEVQLPVTCV